MKLMEAGWDMDSVVVDFARFVLIAQKRQKSGDTSTPLGKKIIVTGEDVEFFADSAEKLVVSYFGTFLS